MQKTSFRAFFAIDIPRSVKGFIAAKIKLLQAEFISKQIKWVKPKNLHLTLCFLGNITEEQYLDISKKVEKAVQGFSSFTVKLTELQLFPSSRKPHALF